MTNPMNYLTRTVIINRASTPPPTTHVFARITDPGQRLAMAVYDATHVSARGVIHDEVM